jgi:16S rRNA (guanine(1405)-N(7))-methyltransferase
MGESASGAEDVVAIVQAVAASPKYKTVARRFISSIARLEAPKERSKPAAVKRVKRRLHQMVGAYIDVHPRYDAWLEDIRRSAGTEVLPTTVAKIQRHHASSRERLSSSTDFYARIFADLPPPATVLDLACGLGPLSRPYMAIPPSAKLIVYDILSDLVTFNIEAVKLMGFAIEGGVWDMLEGAPPVSGDIALLLKTVPCLMQADAALTYPLINGIDAETIIVSFPTKSLGGREKGMASFYEQRFRTIIAGLPRRVETLEIGHEFVFRLHRK